MEEDDISVIRNLVNANAATTAQMMANYKVVIAELTREIATLTAQLEEAQKTLEKLKEPLC